MIKQIFQSSFDAAPATNVILEHMNFPRRQEHDDEVTLDENDEDDEDMWIQLPVEQESIRFVPHTAHNIRPNPLLEFIGNAVKENLMKLGQCIGMEGHGHPSLNAFSTAQGSLAQLETSKDNDSRGVDKDISAYLFALRPFLQGLDNLIGELDMNDPSRV